MNSIPMGQSGYFSKPLNTLDPYLFDGEHLKPNVRTRINDLLFTYLGTAYHQPESWTMVWIAGSGVSYQWSAARGNGDLDVLFGIDYDAFVNSNPDFRYMDRYEISETIDNDLKTNLWPKTAHISFPLTDDDLYSYAFYEVTFFLNPGVEANSDSIKVIQPYAAYNVTEDNWTVKPNPNPQRNFPAEFTQQAVDNLLSAQVLTDRYKGIKTQMLFTQPGSPNEVNAQAQLRNIQTQAKELFDFIHLGRKAAFQPGGQGYGDFYNYQWQAAKRDGIVDALREIIGE